MCYQHGTKSTYHTVSKYLLVSNVYVFLLINKSEVHFPLIDIWVTIFSVIFRNVPDNFQLRSIHEVFQTRNMPHMKWYKKLTYMPLGCFSQGSVWLWVQVGLLWAGPPQRLQLGGDPAGVWAERVEGGCHLWPGRPGGDGEGTGGAGGGGTHVDRGCSAGGCHDRQWCHAVEMGQR